MKYITLVSAAVLASTIVAEAKGGKQVFNAPYQYDYKREQKKGYVKDYCEDSVGNHVYCSMAASGLNASYVSSYQPK